MKVVIINGPNLNLLGIREPQLYGHQTWNDFFKVLQNRFPEIELSYFQSNVEGELVNYIQSAQDCDAGILNPGAYAHTSLAIADALKAVKTPFIEVHITHVFSREPERHVLKSAACCRGTISGFGLEGYAMALAHWAQHKV